MRFLLLFCMVLCLPLQGGCSPAVGSQAWCEKMKEKPKGDWTANELGDFTRHCLFQRGNE